MGSGILRGDVETGWLAVRFFWLNAFMVPSEREYGPVLFSALPLTLGRAHYAMNRAISAARRRGKGRWVERSNTSDAQRAYKQLWYITHKQGGNVWQGRQRDLQQWRSERTHQGTDSKGGGTRHLSSPIITCLARQHNAWFRESARRSTDESMSRERRSISIIIYRLQIGIIMKWACFKIFE